jgi:hypothetical protein
LPILAQRVARDPGVQELQRVLSHEEREQRVATAREREADAAKCANFPVIIGHSERERIVEIVQQLVARRTRGGGGRGQEVRNVVPGVGAGKRRRERSAVGTSTRSAGTRGPAARKASRSVRQVLASRRQRVVRSRSTTAVA